MAKRKRRTFTTDFKAQTVRLIRESGKSMSEHQFDEVGLRHQMLEAAFNRPQHSHFSANIPTGAI